MPSVVDRSGTVARRAGALRISEEVAAALARSRPVVALESTIIAHGLPQPVNLEVAREVESIVRSEGAVPATVAVLDGVCVVGLSDTELERIARTSGVVKASRRDLPMVVATKRDAATTVAATSRLAALAGIDVFATGGLGGVHRGDIWDVSADLAALADTGIVVVCSGVKSILDVRATLERLETHSVPVVGFGTDVFPGFYLTSSGHDVDWRVDEPAAVAKILAASRALTGTSAEVARLASPALVVANPIPEDRQLDPELHDRILGAALEAARAQGVAHAEVTPFILERFHTGTGGASLEANTVLIRSNARLAALIAAAVVA